MSFIGFWNESVPLKKIMEEKLGIPIYVNNNVKNLAIYQMFLEEELSDFFFSEVWNRGRRKSGCSK